METIEPKKNIETQALSALWAVNPAEASLVPDFENFNRLVSLFGGDAFKVKPAYVCADRDLFLSDAKELVAKYLSSVYLAGTSDIEIIYSHSEKKSDLASEIVKVAHAQKAQMIFLSSHARSALGALFWGSFANELLKQSDLPVLFLRPESLTTAVLNKVLFATDFSDESKNSFQKLLRMIKGSNADLILFHTVSMPIQATSAAEGIGYVPQLPNSYIEEEKEWAEKELERWLEEARTVGIQIRFRRIVEESAASVAATIEKVAEEEKVALIALASHHGPVASLFFGSITREILATKKFNTWVVGPTIK